MDTIILLIILAESSPASFTKSGKPRAVRGANRTKKTDQENIQIIPIL